MTRAKVTLVGLAPVDGVPRALGRRRGVTLMELMITMAILALLAAAIVGASSAAMEASRRARTKSTINKLHTLLMERWESYASRRVEVDVQQFSPPAAADIRMLALRELVKLEMPDRWADVVGDSVANQPPSRSSSQRPNAKLLSAIPAVAHTYYRRYQAMTTDDEQKILQHQGAECLYLTIMLNSGDGDAATLFSERDIGDVDGDGAPEFLDGWGQPIQFIRWPTGYVSPMQSVDPLRTTDYDGDNNKDLGDFVSDHDPLDVFRRDVPSDSNANGARSISGRSDFLWDAFGAYSVTPLIYSVGPDGDSEINSKSGFVRPDLDDWTDLDPYHPDRLIGEIYAVGLPDNSDGVDNSADNITNHLLD